VDKPVVKKTIVVYSGRFQPFHKGHYAAYQKLVSKFGANNVYIGTSDKTDGGKSPFNFKEKVVIMGKMFGIPPSKIVKVSNPYAPKEILAAFDGKTTAYIAAVGEKDATRLAGKYFKPYNGKTGYGYDEIGYTYIIPPESNPISGTDVRKWLSSDKAEKLFLKAYPKFDKEIYKMITSKLIKEEFIKGYPSKEDVKKIQKKNDNIRSVATTDDSYVYDPIAEQIAKLVLEADDFIEEYFLEEEPNPVMDKEINYTAADGKKKKITVRGALRLPKDHEAHIQAVKMVGPDAEKGVDTKAQTPKPTTPSQPGQPVKKGDTEKGKMDGAPKGGEKPGEQAPPPEQKLSGAELKSSAEMSPEDKKVQKVKETLDKARKGLSDEDNHSMDTVNNPQSKERKGVVGVLKKAASYIGHGIQHTFEHNKEMMVGTGSAIKSLATTGRFGAVKDKNGKNVHWDDFTEPDSTTNKRNAFGVREPKMKEAPVYKTDSHGHPIKDKDGNKVQAKNWLGKPKTTKEPVFREDLTPEQRELAEKSWKESQKQKNGIKTLAKTSALIIGSIAVTGGIIGGAKAASHGAGAAGIAQGAASKIAYKFGGGHLGSYIMKDIIKHSAAEALGANAIQASGVGIALGAAGIFENKDGDEGFDTKKFIPNFIEKTLEIMQNYKLSDEQMLQAIVNYKKEGPKNAAANLMKEDVNVDVDKGDEVLMGKFKNKKVTIKDIGTDSHGMPTINGKQATTFRTLSEINKGFFKGKIKIGGQPVEVEVELVGADNKTREFVTKVIGIDKKYQSKLPIGSTLPIPAKLFRHGGWVKVKTPSAFNEKISAHKYDSGTEGEEDFTKHHATSMYAPDMGHGAEPDTYDFDDLKDTKPGYQTPSQDKDVEDRGYEPVKSLKEVGSGDWHYKAIMKMYDRATPFGKKKIAAVVSADPKANRRQIERDLRDSDYTEISDWSDKLGLFENAEKKSKAQIIGEFIKFAKERLTLNKFPFQIRLVKDNEFATTFKSYGGYDPNTDEIYVYVTNRSVPDILRTLAHELVHLKQREIGTVGSYKDGETGSDVENEANAAAGILLRDFGRRNGHIYESKQMINEGGAYGHMNHPFDISMNLTFGDLKKIINNALDGKLGVVREKTDGQALAISWKNGKLIAARNKGHLANGGANALDMSALASKFGGRGALSDAYNFAMRDLSAAISGLGEKERQSIFKDGSAFCNLEVIYPENANVIPYGQSLLVFHNVVEYDEKGVAIGGVKGAESKLASMIKNINAHVQSKYTLQGPPITKLPKDEKLSSQKGKFNGMLSRLQSEFGLSDKDGVAEYHYAWWMNFVNKSKKNLAQLEKEGLARRWAFDNKSFTIKSIADEDARKWADGVDKDAKDKIMKGNLRKFEDIFLGVGAEVLSFMSSVLTAQPDSALQSIKASLESSISDIRNGGSEAQIKRLEKELARLNAIGGFEKLVPNEGLVFFYKGNTYKLTGTFAPLNQILGIFKFGR
jgi:hypothetical protein